MYVLLRLPMSRRMSPAAAGSFPPPVNIYIYVFLIPAESGLLLGPGWRLSAHARPWRILGARRNQNKLEARRRRRARPVPSCSGPARPVLARPSPAWPEGSAQPLTSPSFFHRSVACN